MTKRIFIVTVLSLGLFGLTLLAGTPLSLGWDCTLVFEPAEVILLDVFQSVLEVEYRAGSFLAASRSEFQRFGFLWQEFNGCGRLGAFDLRADILFGAATGDYLYAQAIGKMALGGVDMGIYFAHLGDAVYGGPADGCAIRLAASLGALDVISITELGARIADRDFDGITIVHAATGLSRTYVTDPVVAGQGFTGQKVTVGGLGFGCIEEIETTLYITCKGFDFASFELSGIESGISWLTFDLGVTFQTASKTVLLTPALVIGEPLCIAPYFDLSASLESCILGGLDITYSWNGVTFRDVTALGTGRFVITTPEYGSMIEMTADAVERGHEFYADYWELLSIEIDGEACCGGRYTLLLNTYFEDGADKLLGWGMTYVEGSIGLTAGTTLSLSLTVDTSGLDSLAVGFDLRW